MGNAKMPRPEELGKTLDGTWTPQISRPPRLTIARAIQRGDPSGIHQGIHQGIMGRGITSRHQTEHSNLDDYLSGPFQNHQSPGEKDRREAGSGGRGI